MLHLIKREGWAIEDERAIQEFRQRKQFAGRNSRRALLQRSILGALLLGLVPAPLPVLLPSLAPTLEAQASPGRFRHYPVTAPSQPAQAPQTSPAAQTRPAQPAAPPAATPSVPPVPPVPPPTASASAPAAANPVPAANALPPSLLDQPAQPAQIQFSAKSLSIHADNSSLSAILREIASKSGMQLEGFSSDERVFGSFGPGTPRAVLADLLNGAPYDLVMVGDLSNGAPRQLILSPSTSGGPTPPSPQETADNDEQEPPPSRPPEPGREMIPGMNPQTVRTPQQLLQELQQMRERQQQGQAPPPQQH